MNNIIVRFPPSPTGFLHIGNARIAIVNWLFAKKYQGKIILRFDDTDTSRSKDEFKDQMIKDLNWLGLSFDDVIYQSQRVQIYKEVFELLLANNYIYPCFESEEELEFKRKESLLKGRPPIYKFNQDNQHKKHDKPYFRFKLQGEKISWDDEIQGKISYEVKDLSDPVILRANGNFMYTFCSVVDDFLTNATHIIRGADHITNTAIQIKIFEALNRCKSLSKDIKFAHLPLFQGKEGKISKRVGGFSIMEMQNKGYEPEVILNLLAKIGLSYYDDNLKTTNELIQTFDLASFNKSQIIFDFHLIDLYNKKFITEAKFTDIKHRLGSHITEYFFENTKYNVSNFQEVDMWHDILHSKNQDFINLLPPEDKEFAKNAVTTIKNKGFADWSEAVKYLKSNFPERKGKNLFLPIRVALTGKNYGPDMHFIFSIINQ